jgi:hypothetical protein
MSNEQRISDYLSSNTSENPESEFFMNLSKIINVDATLDESIFNDKILGKKMIKYFKFPQINLKEKMDWKFFKIDFVIYLFKEIQSLLVGTKIKYNEEYINSHISNEIFNPYPYNYKSNIPYNSIDTYENESYFENGKRNIINKEIKSNNLISNYNNNIKYQSKNNYFDISPNSSIINKLLNDKNNINSKNKKNYDEESLYSLTNKSITTQVSEIKSNKEKEREKNKNKSVGSIKKKKYTNFSE